MEGGRGDGGREGEEMEGEEMEEGRERLKGKVIYARVDSTPDTFFHCTPRDPLKE